MDDSKVHVEPIAPAEAKARYFAPLLIIRGIVGIIGGIVLLTWPKAALAVAGIALGIFLTIDGIERLVFALREKRKPFDTLALIAAFLKILLGIVILFHPLSSGGFWFSFIFIVTGLQLVFMSVLALRKGSGIRQDFPTLTMTVLMLVLGLVMIVLPVFSTLFLFRLLGAVFVLLAVPSLLIGLRSR